MNQTILILGAGGQIGSELTLKLRSIYGNKNVIASDIKSCERLFNLEGPFEIIDATSRDAVLKVIQKYQVTQVYLLAAMLSATGEKFPQKGVVFKYDFSFGRIRLSKRKAYQASLLAKFHRCFWSNNT